MGLADEGRLVTPSGFLSDNSKRSIDKLMASVISVMAGDCGLIDDKDAEKHRPTKDLPVKTFDLGNAVLGLGLFGSCSVDSESSTATGW